MWTCYICLCFVFMRRTVHILANDAVNVNTAKCTLKRDLRPRQYKAWKWFRDLFAKPPGPGCPPQGIAGHSPRSMLIPNVVKANTSWTKPSDSTKQPSMDWNSNCFVKRSMRWFPAPAGRTSEATCSSRPQLQLAGNGLATQTPSTYSIKHATYSVIHTHQKNNQG